MNPDLSLVLKLQTLDSRSVELEREVAALPKRIAEIEKQLDSHKKRLELDRTALAANGKERKSREDDIKVQEQKISKLKEQMLSAKTNEQYRAFQHEIEFCEKEIRRFEDRILELMSESEKLDKNVKAAEASLATESKQVEAEKQAAKKTTAADLQELATIKAERLATVTEVSKPYYTHYERLRKRPGGIAVAEAVDGTCSVCHMKIRAQVMQELRGNVNSINFCESCKRIIFYNPPVSVEESA
ncbi:MAG: hypothetical protein JNL62_14385 [Bryobacterales bacterium]|nr:hypothetical protein [Bryobacterales bacterium]